MFVVKTFISVLLFAASASAQTVAITHVTIVDTTGAPSQPDRTVVIRDGRIAGIAASAPAQATIVDGRGKFLVPGLCDMHVHLSWTTASALPVLVANGITTVRDMGSRLGEIDDWKTKIATGLLVGPRIFRCGPILNGQKFNAYQMVVGNPDETRGVVRALKQVDIDFLKTHRRTPRESYFALIDEAKKQGLQVVGHIPMTVTPEEASDAGQVTIEHTETLFEGTFSAALKDQKLPDAIRKWRAESAEMLFARFVKNHTAVTPTLVGWHSLIEAYTSPDPRSRYVARSLRKALPPISAQELAEYKQTFAEYIEVVRLMSGAGVILLAGTDTAGPRIPGFTLHEELALLVDAGLTPLQALQAATLNPAKILNRAGDLGAIEAGKVADLVLLDGDPLQDIHNTQRIAAVIVGGKLLRRRDLDALLGDAEQLAARN